MKFLSYVGVLAILIAAAAAVFFFGGFYNVAATEPDLAVVTKAIEHVRDASIARHASAKPPAGLADPAMLQAGARAFSERGCVMCHGAPGVMYAKFAEGLNPGPPDLKDVAGALKPEEIFWIIKNGINMTGMPAFDADDQEVWSIAAFVKKYPDITDADYKAWTAAPAAK